MGVLGKLFTLKQSESDRLLGLESPKEYRGRWISIRVIYYMGFLIYLAFGIVATSIWPYLKSVRRLLHHLNYSERAKKLSIAVGSGYRESVPDVCVCNTFGATTGVQSSVWMVE